MKELTGRLRAVSTGLAWAAAIATPLWFASAALGAKYDLIDWRFALGSMTFSWGPYFLWATLGIGAVALLLSAGYRIAFGRMNGGWISPVLALAVAVGGLGYAASVRATAQSVPPIHDITTDFENPPGFSSGLVERRGAESNSLDYASKMDPRSERPLPEVQTEAYPDIGPILLDTRPEIAFEAALGVARDMGWRVPTASREARVFEATHETFWFGFEDDVSVRVTPTETGGARGDVRSVTRRRASDLGKNAQRIREFEQRLRRSVGEPEPRDA